MVFEAFLGDPRARPARGRLIGYVVSVALHGPPVTLFVVTWLTRALLVTHLHEIPDVRRPGVYYRVPVALVGALPGGGPAGGGVTAALAAGTAGSGHGSTRSARGGKRKARRPLVLPSKKKGPAADRQEKRALGPEEISNDEDDESYWDGPGAGGRPGDGAGGVGPGGPGLAGAGFGPGRGGGLGALGTRPGGLVPRQRPRGSPRRSDDGDLEPLLGDGSDEDWTPRPGRPSRISMAAAAYLRTYDTYPSPLPDSLWPPGRTSNKVLLEICVTEQGEVSDVKVRWSTAPQLGEFLSGSIRSWRYRPRVVQGAALPFCHLMVINYSREMRFGRRW